MESETSMLPHRIGAVTAARQLVGLALLLSSAACTTGPGTYPANAPARSASDTPERYMVGTIQPGGALTAPRPNAGCRNPVIDPRDRLDCSTGRAVGIIPRGV
jgi:hypothetical protein